MHSQGGQRPLMFTLMQKHGRKQRLAASTTASHSSSFILSAAIASCSRSHFAFACIDAAQSPNTNHLNVAHNTDTMRRAIQVVYVHSMIQSSFGFSGSPPISFCLSLFKALCSDFCVALPASDIDHCIALNNTNPTKVTRAQPRRSSSQTAMHSQGGQRPLMFTILEAAFGEPVSESHSEACPCPTCGEPLITEAGADGRAILRAGRNPEVERLACLVDGHVYQGVNV